MKTCYVLYDIAFSYQKERISKYILSQDYLPLNPYMLWGYDFDEAAISKANTRLLSICDEIWVFGKINDDILSTIITYKHWKAIRYFSLDLHEIYDVSKLDIDSYLLRFDIDDLEKMLTSNLIVTAKNAKYDKEHDVLHVIFSNIANSSAEEVYKNIYVYYDDDNLFNNITGLKILDFSHNIITIKENKLLPQIIFDKGDWLNND